MQRIFQINLLCVGLVLACPSLVAQSLPTSVVGEEKFVKMPVEVVGVGGKSEWVMVEISNEAVPEPSAAALLALTSLLLLRRRRGK